MTVQVRFLSIGDVYLEKNPIPDSIFLVHSKISTISGDVSSF